MSDRKVGLMLTFSQITNIKEDVMKKRETKFHRARKNKLSQKLYKMSRDLKRMCRRIKFM